MAIAQSILPETEEQDLNEMIDVYLRYTRPENTRCRDYRLGDPHSPLTHIQDEPAATFAKD